MTTFSEISDSLSFEASFEETYPGDCVDLDLMIQFVAQDSLSTFSSKETPLDTSLRKRPRLSFSLNDPSDPLAEMLSSHDLFPSSNSDEKNEGADKLSSGEDLASNVTPFFEHCFFSKDPQATKSYLSLNPSAPLEKSAPAPSELPLPLDAPRDYLERALRENDVLSAILVAKDNNQDELLVEIAQSLLEEAITWGNNELAKSCLEVGININFFNQQGLTPLILALVNRNRFIIEELIKKRADLTLGYQRFPKRNPAVAASLLNIKGFEDLLILTKEDRLMIALTQACLGFGISPKEDSFIANSIAINSYISEIAQDSDIKKAFAKAASIYRNSQDDLKQDEIVIFNTGTLNHAISLLFAKVKGQDILAVCNRGMGSSKDHTIRYFPIERAKFNDDCDRQLLEIEQKENFTPECAEFFNTTLPQLLQPAGASSIDIDFLSRIYQPKEQKSGNCTVASSKAAAGAIFALKTYETFSETLSLEKMQQKTKLMYKQHIGLQLRSYLMARLEIETQEDDTADEFKRLLSDKLKAYQDKVSKLMLDSESV